MISNENLKSPHFNMQPFGAEPDTLTEYLLGLEKINEDLIKNYDILNVMHLKQ
jgi:hypothetical protein